MKIFFNNQDGRIFYAVYDRDWFAFSHTTNIPLAEFEVDEVDPDNKAVCIDLVRTRGKVDINRDGKYYMLDNAGTWELHERDGWEEYVEGFV